VRPVSASREKLMASGFVETFRASLGRCMTTPNFLHEFYELFIASSPEVREKFRDTEFARQTRVLSDSLYIMAVAAESRDDSVGLKEMDRLAVRHAHSDLDIRPELYDAWLDCLLEAARRHDPEFSSEVEGAWRETLLPGIQHMRSRYRAPEP
jgi:hemoglobin-like flavoprotein